MAIMMSIQIDVLVSMALYAAMVLVAPGPTNTLLLASGLTVGIKKTLPLIAAEVAGYVAAIALWGTLLAEITAKFSWAPTLVKALCCCAILATAIKLWRYSPNSKQENEKAVGIKSLFLATLTNPKSLVFAGAIFPSESFKSASAFAAAILMFVAVLIPIGIGWSAAGTVLAKQSKGRFSVSHVTKFVSIVLVFGAGVIFAVLVSQQI